MAEIRIEVKGILLEGVDRLLYTILDHLYLAFLDDDNIEQVICGASTR